MTPSPKPLTRAQKDAALEKLLLDFPEFCERASDVKLRAYQLNAGQAILSSVLREEGETIVVMFPRQSGKNELQAQLEAYLLTLLEYRGGEMVKISPTWKPQSLNAMRRLERVLKNNGATLGRWRKESGYIYVLGAARITFLSGSPETNIVGATASTLLEVDEAQEIQIDKFDRDIAPMAASTNATRVFWGTAWTARTLLARELRAARRAERRDGRRRAFVLAADEVALEVPSYGKYVAGQVARLGRDHLMVRTQYFSEEIDAESGMFPARRQALMLGNHSAQHRPVPGSIYAFTMDVAGEDEGMSAEALQELSNPGRDSTALTIFTVDLTTRADRLIAAPSYRVVGRWEWVGTKHTSLYAQIMALVEVWKPRYLVIDATGVGAGLSSFLEKALPGRVIPYLFNAQTKSKLGWDYLTIVEQGRFKDYLELDALRAAFNAQLSECQMEIFPGPERRMRWGVPDGTRSPAAGELVHDDLLLSAALCAALDKQEWSVAGPAVVVRAVDPLKQMDKESF
jgi:hypothetical protein